MDVVTHKLVSKEGLLAEIERMGVGSDVNSLHKDIEVRCRQCTVAVTRRLTPRAFRPSKESHSFSCGMRTANTERTSTCVPPKSGKQRTSRCGGRTVLLGRFSQSGIVAAGASDLRRGTEKLCWLGMSSYSSLCQTAPQDAGIEDAEHKDDVAAAEEEEAIPEYVERPVIPGDWASLGSEEAVQLLEVKPTRPRLGFTISRPRREFGIERAACGSAVLTGVTRHAGIRVQFNDADPADKIAEYPRQMQPGYDLMRSTLDTAVQAVPPTIDLGTQTRWYRKVNHSTQSAPIRMSAAKTREIMASTKMKRFVTSAFNK